MASSRLINIQDYAAEASRSLPREVHDYYAGGALDEITLRDSHAAYDRIRLNYRVLAGIDQVDLSTKVLGTDVSMPLLVAPTAFHRMAHADGEAGAARAAGRAGTLFVLSSLSNTAMETVIESATGPVWFQLYIYKDRGVTEALLRRAEAAGAEAIVLTVDAPVWGTREKDVRNQFGLPPGLAVENLSPAGKESFPESEGSGLAAYVDQMFDGALDWSDLAWLCAATPLPVIVKGICDPRDAVLAIDNGAQAVVVSNHGGRQLDTAVATIDALPAVAEAVDGRIDVLVDGGIRRGTDVIKAVARGATAVLVGRPVLWGLSVNGEEGVVDILDILYRELSDGMALCGCRQVSDIGPDLLFRE